VIPAIYSYFSKEFHRPRTKAAVRKKELVEAEV
jgi:hypothetical protein